MPCQRHPSRQSQCGCMSLCTECRGTFPVGCDCLAKKKIAAVEKEQRLEQIQQKQRTMGVDVFKELIESDVERKLKHEHERVVMLEKELAILAIEAEVEKKNLEIAHCVELRERFNTYDERLMKVISGNNEVLEAMGKTQKIDVVALEKVQSKDSIGVESEPEKPVEEVEKVFQESEKQPEREDNLEEVKHGLGPDIVGKKKDTLKLKRTKVMSAKSRIKKEALEAKKASWERLTGTLKSTPKLQLGKSRSTKR